MVILWAYFEFGKEAGFELVVLVGVGVFLMPAFWPSSGIVFEANRNPGNLEVVVATYLFQLSLRTLIPAQATFFTHAREKANLGNAQTLGDVTSHNIRVWLSCDERAFCTDKGDSW